MKRRDFLKSALIAGGACLVAPQNILGQVIRRESPSEGASSTTDGQAEGQDQEGMFFDVQRFGLHDGPGIRTVVFLKGCPLRCAWCFNPESFARREQLMFLVEKCVNCGVCVGACSDDALEMVNGKLKISFAQCTACGKCADVCPKQAMKIVGYRSSVKDIVDVAERDMRYYGSDGGVTLSGGEAMFQPEVTKQLLKALKAEGIHTCIETSGYADRQYYSEVLPYVDIFLFDYKVTGEAEHQRWTRVSNKKILDNLDFISANGASVVLRCPVIPGVNDNDTHFAAIAGLGKRYPNIDHAEIEPYVSFGADKYAQIGRKASVVDLKSVDNAQAQQWVERVRSFGYEKVKLS